LGCRGGFRIVLRTDPNKEVTDYNYEKTADESWRVTELVEKRLVKHINGIPTLSSKGTEKSLMAR